MFKFRTLVVTFLFTSILSFGFLVNAEDKENNDASALKQAEEMCKDGSPYRENRTFRKCAEDTLALLKGQPSAGSCKEASNQLNEKASKFISACGKIGISGAQACIKQDLKCSQCINNVSGDEDNVEEGCEDFFLAEDEDEDEISSADVSSFINGIINPNQFGGIGSKKPKRVTPNLDIMRNYLHTNHCPVKAQADLKDLIKETEELEKVTRSIEDEIAEKKQELADLENDWRQKMEDFEVERKKMTESYENTQLEYREKLEQAQAGLKEAIAELQGKQQEAERALLDLDIQENEEIIRRDQEISKLKSGCYQAAVARVAQYREMRSKLIDQSKFSSENFTSLMKSVGLSSRQQAIGLVEKYEKQCLRDPDFARAMQNIEKIHQGAMTRIQGERKKLKGTIETISQAISDALKEVGPLAQKYGELIERAHKRFMDKMATLRKSFENAQIQYMTKTRLLNEEISRKMAQLAEQKDYLQQKNDYLEIKMKYSRGSGLSVSESEITEALGMASEVLSLAQYVQTACSCGDAPSDQGACDRSCDYLKAADRDCAKPSPSINTKSRSTSEALQ